MSPQELAALAALRNYVNAAVTLLDAWEKIGPFDVLTENIPDPESFVEFGEQVSDLILWRDRVARALDQPVGDGSSDDEVPPRPPEIPADEPEDPALDIERSDGTTPRERFEADARLEALRAQKPLPLACGALRGMENWQPTCDLPPGHEGAHRWTGPSLNEQIRALEEQSRKD